MSRSIPRALRACGALVLSTLVLVVGGPGSPAGASNPSSSPDSYTFSTVRTVDTNGTETFSDDVTTFTYTLVAAPEATGSDGVSHVLFAAFCATPIGYTPGQFLEPDGSTGDLGLKREAVAIGDAFSFDFAGNHDATPGGATIVIKQGDEDRTIEVEGPACPANQDPAPCGSDEVRDDAGDCVPVPCDDDEVRDPDTGACEPAPVSCEAPDVLDPETGECGPEVVPCAADEVLDAETGECGPEPVPCAAPDVADPVTSECGPVVVPCEAPGVVVDGRCEDPIDPSDPVVLPVTCPDGTTMTEDVDGDGAIDADDCTVVLPDPGAEPTVPVPTVPAEPSPTLAPSTATPIVAPAAVPAPAPADSAVLGAQVTRAPLARTGSSSTGLAAFGAMLVLLGASATMAGRRTART